MKKLDRYPLFVAVFILALILSIHGVKYVPFYSYTGLDLQNLYVFHHQCGGWPIPYERAGAACGDPLNRPMVYPPLAYWAMAWVRFFDFRPAVFIWQILIVFLTGFGIELGTRSEGRVRPWLWLVGILFFFQMPLIFAVERANIDALVVPTFVIGAVLLAKRKAFPAGLLFATACWLKVYPVIPSVILLVGLYFDRELRKTLFRPLFLGFLAGGLGWAAVLLPDSVRYFTEVLPRFAAEKGGFGVSSHSLYRGVASLGLKLPLLALWTFVLGRALRRDPLFAALGALSISTFFQNLSNDYNLITAYPFLFLVLNRLLRPGMTGRDFGILLLTFFAFVGDRTPMEALLENRGALFVQIVWFVVFPLYLWKRIDKGGWIDGNLSLV